MSVTESADYQRAAVLYQQRRYSDAELLLTALLAEHPEDLDLRQALANCHGSLGRTNAAIAGFRWIVERDPRRYVDARNLGLLYEKIGAYREAAEAYRRVLAVTDFENTSERLRAVERMVGPTALDRPLEHTVVQPVAADLIVPGPAPLLRVMEETNSADPGTVERRYTQRVRYALLDVAFPVGMAVLATAVVAIVIPAIIDVLPDAVREPVDDGWEFVSGVIGWLLFLAWLVVAALVGRCVLRAKRYEVIAHQRGVDLSEGVLTRGKQFFWYYQMTQEPEFYRTAVMAVLNVATLVIKYNDSSNTTQELHLRGIGTAEQVEDLRRFVLSRRTVDRRSIRGPF